MREVYKLKPAAIAVYPMYRGLARLVGMDILETGSTVADEFGTLKANWSKYDYFYLHIKKTDSYGEDGNFEKKTDVIAKADPLLKTIFDLKPDVCVVTCDHSTPCAMKGHSWHPCPILLTSRHVLPDEVKTFTERECRKGGLGRIMSVDVIPLMLAHSLRLQKYGA